MKIAFLSTFALDANASLINAMQKKCDIYFFIEALYEISNFLDKEKLQKTITVGTEVEELKNFSDFISLDKTYVIKGTRNIDIIKKLYISYKVNQLIKKINPDVIILDNYMLTYLVSTLEFRKKMLMVVHDPFLHSGENYFIDRCLRRFHFRMIKHKIILNEKQKDDFIEHYGFNAKYVHTSFLSIYDFLKFYQKDKNKVAPSDFNVLFFGRISPYKGIKYLLDAFVGLLSEKHGNISLTIAGSGKFDFEVTEYLRYPEIKILNQYIYPENLAQLISNSSIIVCPYTDATQSGVIMSAFAFNKPVIATNVGGLPEMVEHEKTGLIVEPKNSEELHRALSSLFNNKNLLKEMSDNIKKEYSSGAKSWEISAEKFIEACIRVI